MLVKFYDKIDDDLLKFAVIISKSNSKWVFCKHRDRDTYEVPGGHREAGEFEEELHSEMEKVVLLDELPDEWTYPLIQPLLIAEYERRKSIRIYLVLPDRGDFL